MIPQNNAFSIGLKLDEQIGYRTLSCLIRWAGIPRKDGIVWRVDNLAKLTETDFAVEVENGLPEAGDFVFEAMITDGQAKIIGQQTIPVTITPNAIGQ